MRFFPSEPDIETVFNRIRDGDIDLQPDFQRNEVWPLKKQQRLIDSILRSWVIPPILLISNGHRLQVLDGQQRLASIRDFKLNEFSVDGEIEPVNTSIKALNGFKYSSLAPEIAKAFDRTPLRMYEIADFLPEEPAEIFFRLNQPTTLTSAERRNALFGPVRNQVRDLVDMFESSGEASKLLAFSNARMAYDDVLARFAFTLEERTLKKRVTEAAVSQMYRRPVPLDGEVCEKLDRSLKLLLGSLEAAAQAGMAKGLKLNKAAFYSWLMFFSRLDATGDPRVTEQFFVHFESVRGAFHNLDDGMAAVASQSGSFPLLLLFSDRATARVSDVSSVLLRDFALWASWFEFSGGTRGGSFDPAYREIPRLLSALRDIRPEQYEPEVLAFLDEVNWGANL